MDIMEQRRRRTDILNPKIRLYDNGYRHRHHHHQHQQHQQLPPVSLSAVSMMIGILVVVTSIIITSPHHIHSIIEYNNYVSVVSATKQTYTIQTPRISSLTKSNIGWCIIPRGGMDTNEEDNNKTTPDVVSSSNIIRIRMLDGTIQKLLIPFDQWNTQSVLEIIRQSVVTSNSGISSDQPKQLQPQQISYNVTLPNGSIYTCHLINENDADGTTNNDSISFLETSLENLGFKHGALVTIRPNKSNDHTTSTEQASQSTRSKKWMTSHNNKNPPHERRFDPYPELAKDYDTAVRNAKIRRNTAGGLTSYSTIAALQSSLHTVEPQSTGTIQRIYMCHVAAAQFHARCSSSSSIDDKANRPTSMALLLGTITTERKDLNQPKRARTSLSSTVEGDQYCSAARVHAIWEPPSSKVITTTTTTTTPNDTLEETKLLLQHLSPSETTNVIRVAQYLGLQPIGWMFSYSNDRTGGDINSDGGLPVWGMEIDIGARLQIEYMKRYCHENHHSTIISKNNDDVARTTNMVPRFGTLAMDAITGATEAFQLSDVAVQMVAEDMLVLGEHSFQASNGRYITTRHPVIVDGKETNQLDSVLCLVNVALLSHTSMFTGPTATLSTKTKRDSRRISNKIRKAIVKAIVDDDNDENTIGNGDATNKLFEIISDFNILLALDGILNENDSEQLCRTLYKWARGQKRSVKLDSQLKERLRRALDIT